jgi:hypothetical protein
MLLSCHFHPLSSPNLHFPRFVLLTGGCLQVQGTYYHNECFYCHECRSALSTSLHYVEDGDVYCKHCYLVRSLSCSGALSL